MYINIYDTQFKFQLELLVKRVVLCHGQNARTVCVWCNYHVILILAKHAEPCCNAHEAGLPWVCGEILGNPWKRGFS